MNNLVFNNTASALKASIYGQAPDSTLRLLKLDDSDNLLVAGAITVSEITSPITIANETLTVAGTVTVSEITSPVTIANETLTVAGTVTVSEITSPVTIANESLTVAGTVTVSEITSPITIGGYLFTSDSAIDTPVTGTGVVFADTDISQVKTASLFCYNRGTSPITLSLQISPTTVDDDYIDDPNYTDVVLAVDEKKYIAVSSFANYARLQYNMGAATGTLTAYYNAQT